MNAIGCITVLDAEVDIGAGSVARNLDTIGERRQRTVRPAAAAILRNVLVQRLGDERAIVDIRPAEGIRQRRRVDVRVRQRRCDEFAHRVSGHALHFIETTQHTAEEEAENANGDEESPHGGRVSA
jgi:Tfp pilus assembly pilus retraction ATPase PilT